MLEQYSMGGGSVVAPAARAAAEQNLTSAGVAADEDPVVREELVLLDFPEFSFAPFLKKQKHVTLPATAGAAVGAAAELAAEAVEAGTASLTAPDIAPLVSKEDPTTAVSADEAMSGSGDATSASVAAQAAFLRRADLELRAWNLGTSAPSLLLGNFSFKGERQSQRISSTALFRIVRQQSEQDKAAVSGDGAQVHLQGIAEQVMSFAVDTTAAASKASCDAAAAANHA